MRCTKCSHVFDQETSSVLCPHYLLDQIAPPQGGFRIPTLVKQRLEDCVAAKDYNGLYQEMGSANPLVRTIAAHAVVQLIRNEES